MNKVYKTILLFSIAIADTRGILQWFQGSRNAINLFIHKSSFDILRRRKGESEKEERYASRSKKDWKLPASKKRGIEKRLKKDKECKQERKEIRRRKMVAKAVESE